MKNHAEPHWGRVTARDWPKPPQDIMKQLPVLEPGDKPRKQTWYTLTPVGDSLCAQVGHRCSYLPPVGDAERGKVFIVGGADPNRSFSDVHTIDLGKTNSEGDSLAVQWLGLQVSTVGNMYLIPGWRTRIPCHVAWFKKKKKNRPEATEQVPFG